MARSELGMWTVRLSCFVNDFNGSSYSARSPHDLPGPDTATRRAALIEGATEIIAASMTRVKRAFRDSASSGGPWIKIESWTSVAGYQGDSGVHSPKRFQSASLMASETRPCQGVLRASV